MWPCVRVYLEPVINGIHNGLIHGDRSMFARLGLFDFQTVASFQIIYLMNFQGENFPCAVGCVDSEGEQAQIARIVCVELLNPFYSLEITDWLDLDRGAFFRVVGVACFLCFRHAIHAKL